MTKKNVHRRPNNYSVEGYDREAARERRRKRRRRVVLIERLVVVFFLLIVVGGTFLLISSIKSHAFARTKEPSDELNKHCVNVLNEAVNSLNNNTVTLDTVDYCIKVLCSKPDMPETFTVLDAIQKREIGCKDWSEVDFEKYINLLQNLIRIYDERPTEELKNEIARFALPGFEEYTMNMTQVSELLEIYAILERYGIEGEYSTLETCIDDALAKRDMFAPAFDIFESGIYLPIKDFMQSEEYISLRDEFLEGRNTEWEGATYIPVSREMINIMYSEDKGYTFSFPDFEDGEQSSGVINIWAVNQQDDGVQRLAISYEPPRIDGEYYPHNTYEFIYLYSNVKIDGEYVPMMNYRFETRTLTEEGENTVVIGDWGGEHEWTDDF